MSAGTLVAAAREHAVDVVRRADVDRLRGRIDVNVGEEAARQPLRVLADPVHDLGRWARGTRAMHDGDARTALHHLGQMRLGTVRRLVALDRIEAAGPRR